MRVLFCRARKEWRGVYFTVSADQSVCQIFVARKEDA
jgi:hypothetical protein